MRARNALPLTAVILLLAACSQTGPRAVALETPVNQTIAPTTSATSAPPSTTMAPGQQRVLDTNAGLTTALFGISTATSRVKASNALGAPRKAVADSLASARTRLSAERTAAFGSVRSCTAVLSDAAQVRVAAAGVATGRAQVAQVTAGMRTQVNGLTQAVSIVAARLRDLQTALASEAHPPPVVSSSEVQSAMASARTFAADTLAAAASADANAAAAVSNANRISSQAANLAAKAC